MNFRAGTTLWQRRGHEHRRLPDVRTIFPTDTWNIFNPTLRHDGTVTGPYNRRVEGRYFRHLEYFLSDTWARRDVYGGSFNRQFEGRYFRPDTLGHFFEHPTGHFRHFLRQGNLVCFLPDRYQR